MKSDKHSFCFINIIKSLKNFSKILLNHFDNGKNNKSLKHNLKLAVPCKKMSQVSCNSKAGIDNFIERINNITSYELKI